MKRNTIKEMLKKQEQEKEASERKERLSGLIMSAWRQKDYILANPDIYVTELPECKSGTSIGGPIYLPLGALVECWDSCPEFRLPDGRYVIRFASGLSGYTRGEAICLKTGKITDYESSALIPNTRAVLMDSSAPYRRKAAELIKSGTLPLGEDELESKLKINSIFDVWMVRDCNYGRPHYPVYKVEEIKMGTASSLSKAENIISEQVSEKPSRIYSYIVREIPVNKICLNDTTLSCYVYDCNGTLLNERLYSTTLESPGQSAKEHPSR